MSKTTLPLVDPETAPEASRALLEAAQAETGMIPNLYRAMANSPQLLEGYRALYRLFDATSLTPVERQVVLLSVSYINACSYCMAGHSLMAEFAGVTPEIIAALRAGEPLPDSKLAALAAFTRAVVEGRGQLADDQLQVFLDAGYTQTQVLEVILGVGVKTMSNYTNHVVHTPLDPIMQARAWTKPAS